MGRTKLTLLLISSLTIMAASLVAPALPSIAEEFEELANAQFLSRLVLSLPALFIAISAAVSGRLIDRYGRMIPLYTGLLLYAVSGTAVYFVNDLYIILGFRAILGISIGLVSTVAITLIGDYYEGAERSKLLGAQASFIGFAGMIFLLFGGWLADVSWRHPFLLYLAVLILIPLSVVSLDDRGVRSQQKLAKLDLTPTLYMVFGTGFVLMLLFYIIPTQLPFLVREAGQSANSMSGIALSLNAIGMMITSIGFGRVVRGISHHKVFAIGFVIMGLGHIIAGLASSYGLILVGVFVAGAGLGFAWPNLNYWALSQSSNLSRGRVIGMLTTCFFLGQFMSPIVAQPLLSHSSYAALFNGSGVVLIVLGILFAVSKRKTG